MGAAIVTENLADDLSVRKTGQVRDRLADVQLCTTRNNNKKHYTRENLSQ